MENRDSIIRKLNALRAKAYDKSIADTPEAISALTKFNELMQRYNLTLTDLEVRESKIGGFNKKPTKTTDYMKYLVLGISQLTNTEVIPVKGGEFLFIGIGADIAYANWIYDLVSNALENSTIAYKIGPDYHKRINNGEKPAKIMEAFKNGFVYAVSENIQKLTQSNSTGNSLMVLKNDLIASFMQEQGINTPRTKSTAIKVADNHTEVMQNGYREGNKVRLRQEVN